MNVIPFSFVLEDGQILMKPESLVQNLIYGSVQLGRWAVDISPSIGALGQQVDLGPLDFDQGQIACTPPVMTSPDGYD